MYCTKCGAKLEPNERFCPFCGQTVDDPLAQPAVSPSSKPETTSSPPSTPAPAPAPAGNGPVNGKLIAAIAAAVVVILAAVLIAVFLRGRGDEPGIVAESPDVSLPTEPSEVVPESSGPEASGPVESEPVESEPMESGPVESNPASSQLTGLYIGAWVAEGCTIDDNVNGWQALDVQSVTEDTLTFTLESVSAAPYNRVADTYPITVTMEDGKGTFPVNDSWGNSGTGTIAVKGNALHVMVDITSPDMTAMWDVGMDADFYPANSSSSQQGQSTQIVVMAGGSVLPLAQAPYLNDGRVMIPMEPVFTAVGITVFEDEYVTLVAMTESHSVGLNDWSDWSEGMIDCSLEIDGTETDWDRSGLIGYIDGCYYVPLDTLDVFGLQTSWDPTQGVAKIQGSIAASDRVSAQKVEALKGFDMDEAAQRVQNAGYSFATAGAECWYSGGSKTHAIPVTTADGIQYALVTYDGTYYQMGIFEAE